MLNWIQNKCRTQFLAMPYLIEIMPAVFYNPQHHFSQHVTYIPEIKAHVLISMFVLAGGCRVPYLPSNYV